MTSAATEHSWTGLVTALDSEILVLEALSECIRREVQHLLAFDARSLDSVLAEKRGLIKRADGMRLHRELMQQSLGSKLGLTAASGTEPTLEQCIERLDHKMPMRATLSSRRRHLGRLVESLTTMNARAGAYASRHLNWVRRSTSVLRPTEVGAEYGPQGRQTSTVNQGHRVRASV